MPTQSQRAVVAVIGGGPAGLMAAEVVASAGHAVTVFERHRSVGRKLLLAGRSGLNLTHSEPHADLVSRYQNLSPAVVDALSAFDSGAVRAWADGLGAQTFVGSSGRVFPAVMRAAPMLRAWIRRLADLGVEWRPNHDFAGWADDGRLRFVVGETEELVDADATVLAFGGASWPRVSSSGEWATALDAAGIDVAPLRAANVGVRVPWSAVFLDRFEGEPVKNVVARLGDARLRGDLVVTRSGLEGGPVYALSSSLGSAEPLRLDLVPDLDDAALRARLDRGRPKDSQSTWLRKAGFTPIAIGLLREATRNRIPASHDELIALVRDLALPVDGAGSLDRAISTAGGVRLSGLDDHFMLRARPGVFAAGEMLDWDAPTGGYLLHGCLATGRAAGDGVVAYLRE